MLCVAACSAALLFTGCQKDDDILAYEYTNQGFIKGTITGTTKDNSALAETFNFTGLRSEDGPSTYTIDADGNYFFEISREDPNSGGIAFLSFQIENANDNTPEPDELGIQFVKETDKYFSFYIYENSDNTYTITDFSFNATTGQVKGKYSISGTNNSTGKNASVTGEFDVIAKRFVD